MAGAHIFLLCLSPLLAAAQKPQGQEPPKWMTDAGKDLFNDLQSSEKPYDEATCEIREALLKSLTGIGDREASHYRYLVLKELGMCEFIKGNFDKAKKRLDSGVSELNLPNDDMMTTNQELAPVGLLRQAAGFLNKFELTQAATALRRSREIADRNLKKILKMVHKQMSQQAGSKGNIPPVENLIAEIPGFGKTGQVLPMLMGQAPILKQELPFAEQIDVAIEALDKRLMAFAPQQKAIRKALDTSKGSSAGTLLYARGLVTEDVVPADRLMAATELTETGAAKAFKEEAASIEKSLTLLKRTVEGTGCKDKGMDKTCAALAKIPDLKSNGFGETRVIVVKADKKQPLDRCSTNANVAILLSAQDGVTAKVGASSTVLLAGLPVVVDFCQEVTLESSKQAVVLFAMAWHPEFAAVERTTELRTRSSAFGLSEDAVKEATKVVNDHAKKNWEKAGKQWREDSTLVTAITTSLKAEKDKNAAEAEAAAEAERKDFLDNDETRKKNLEELEASRAQKKKEKDEKAAAKRKAVELAREQERANRDPWLNDPTVLAADKVLEDLKEARRDANNKLEFDLTAQLTKDISAAERAVKKATKAAKKAFKKGGGTIPVAKASEVYSSKDSAADKEKAGDEIKKKLEDVKKEKAAAAEAENFGEAKRLKTVQKDLEEKLKKLEL